MLFWILNCLFVFVLSVLCACIIIPQILRVSFKRNLFDEPDERKIHSGVVPRLGGFAFNPVVFFSIVFCIGINILFRHYDLQFEVSQQARPVAFGFCAVLVMFLLGIVDDLIGVRYRMKFIAQTTCAIMIIAGGVYIDDFQGILMIHKIPVWVAYPFTVLLTVFIINAINLIDGIDGLCSGLCSIAFLTYGFFFFYIGGYIYAMVSFATFGALIPFYYYNVFGSAAKHKKIFMGDTGTLTIGMLLSFLSMKLVISVPAASVQYMNPLIIAYSPLMVPCLDVIRVYLHRIRNGRNPFLPDKNHIHHKLLACGMSQQMAMVGIVTLSLFTCAINILLVRYFDITLVLVFDIVVWTAWNLWLNRKIEERRKSTAKKS